jgi:sialate O-acetylesterase
MRPARLARISLLAFACGCRPGLPSPPAGEPPRLASLFTDHLVLQRGVRVPVWGAARPGQHITVSFRDQRVEVVTGGDGRWTAHLAPLAPGGPFELVASGAATVTLHDVLVGEVWLASGQSNMAFPLELSAGASGAIAAAARPRLRLFTVPRDVADAPRATHGGRWDVASPETAARFSAVAYHFGRELEETLGVPVGLINASSAGSPAEAFMSPAALRSDPAFASIFTTWATKVAEHRAEIDRFEPVWQAWRAEADRAIAAGVPFPAMPIGPEGPRHHYHPSSLHHAMLSPLAPYALRGVLFYQGEGNVDRAAQYGALFPALIGDVRALFGEPALPFLFAQLASYGEDAGESERAALREAQRLALSVPGTSMAVTIDVGDPHDVHPKNKAAVGHRLALAARAEVYGEAIESSGPLYASMTVEGGALRLRFRHAGGGLVAQRGGPLRGFAVAGADGLFARAEAAIDGDTVVVSRRDQPAPRSVRYAWADSPDANLGNGAGLPASPFRADVEW